MPSMLDYTSATYGPGQQTQTPDPSGFYAMQTPSYLANGANAYTQQLGQNLQNQQFGVQKQFDYSQLAQNKQLTQQGFANQIQQAKIAQTPAWLQQQRFNKVFPFVQNAMKGIGGTGGSLGGVLGGQASQYSPQGPHISAGPVYNQQTTNAQINQQRAQSDQQAAGQIQQQRNQMAGSGYGANSPLAQLLQANTLAQNQAGNASMATGLRFNSAQANAQQLLGSQQAQEAQFGNRQQEQIARQKTQAGTLSSLLQSYLGTLGQIA